MAITGPFLVAQEISPDFVEFDSEYSNNLHPIICSSTGCMAAYAGESNENAKSTIKIRNTARFSVS